MIDIAYEETETLLEELEKKITKVYSQAAKETEEKLKHHMERYAANDKIKREKLAKGEITREEYINWRMGQIAIGQRWEAMRNSLSQDLLNAHKIAVSMIKEYEADAFALNHNYETFCIERDSLVDTSYTLYNRDAVTKLIRDDPIILPPPQSPDVKLLRLYNQKIQSAVLQGILQGEGAYKIAKRMKPVTDAERKATIRNARTGVTMAQNSGRHQAAVRAQDMGINRVEVWSAVMDGRTRHAHRLLDGQVKDVNGVFHSELGDIRYPADPQAEPANVYNCRCALITRRAGKQFIDSYRARLQERRNPELANTTYEEWKQGKGYYDYRKKKTISDYRKKTEG